MEQRLHEHRAQYVDKSMKEIFGLSADAQASPELGRTSDDDRQTYIMKQ